MILLFPLKIKGVKNLIINVGEDFTEDLELFSADGTGVVDLTNFTA